jgi:hypothetical protein
MVLESHPTFACPHCGAVYPFRPVLVDRAVRCTKCTKPFKVRADRTVEKVEDTAPVPPPETSRVDKLQRAQAAGKTARLSKTTTTPRPPSSAERPPVRSPASEALTPKVPDGAVTAKAQAAGETTGKTEAAAAAAKASADTKKTAGKSLSEQQEEMRRRMSASLNTMAGKLAAKEEPPAEPTDMVVGDGPEKTVGPQDAPPTSGTGRHQTVGRPADLRAPARMTRASDTERRNAKVVLGNDGERQQREERSVVLWLGAALLVPVVLVAVWWCWPDAKGDALRRFAAPPDGEGAVMARYAETLAKRGWMEMPQVALVDPGSFSFASGSSYPLAGISEVLAPLHGLVFDPGHALWTAPGKTDAIFLAWNGPGDRAAHLSAAAASIGTVIDQATIKQNLGKGMDPAAADIIAQLATGRSGGDGHALLDDLITHPPTRLDVAPFTGAGTCINPGPSSKRTAVSYQGLLLRITGPGWPHGWLVFEVTAR